MTLQLLAGLRADNVEPSMVLNRLNMSLTIVKWLYFVGPENNRRHI